MKQPRVKVTVNYGWRFWKKQEIWSGLMPLTNYMDMRIVFSITDTRIDAQHSDTADSPEPEGY